MAINRSTPGTVIVSGYVDRIQEQRTGAEKGNRVYAHDVTIETAGGGRLAVRLWLREGADAIPLPTIGEFVAYVSSVSERRDNNGTLRAELHAQHVLTPGEVDSLNSSLAAPAKG